MSSAAQRKLLAALLAVHAGHYATWTWQPVDDQPAAVAPVRAEAPPQQPTFDSEELQHEDHHREGSPSASGGGRVVQGTAALRAVATLTAGGRVDPPASLAVTATLGA